MRITRSMTKDRRDREEIERKRRYEEYLRNKIAQEKKLQAILELEQLAASRILIQKTQIKKQKKPIITTTLRRSARIAAKNK